MSKNTVFTVSYVDFNRNKNRKFSQVRLGKKKIFLFKNMEMAVRTHELFFSEVNLDEYYYENKQPPKTEHVKIGHQERRTIGGLSS